VTEPEPTRDVALSVAPGIRRVIANNPGPMTYYGTNTYLIDTEDGVVVVDPGPDLPEHVDAIVHHAARPIVKIGLTHGHRDHGGCAAALVAATGAVTYGFSPSVDSTFVPDVKLTEGDEFAGMSVIYTPGHAPDHLCFARDEDGILFTGDHVMGWSTTFIGAPAGNMHDYLASLQRLLQRDDKVYLSAHGPPLTEPRSHVNAMLLGRLKREREILAFLRAHGPSSTDAILTAIYPKATAPRIKSAAERTLLAHLFKLEMEAKAEHTQDLWAPA